MRLAADTWTRDPGQANRGLWHFHLAFIDLVAWPKFIGASAHDIMDESRHRASG
jgi:hypothetical protein